MPATTTEPTCCIRCGQPLRRQEQHWTHKPDVDILVDCQNRSCKLYMATATVGSYTETVSAFLAAPAGQGVNKA